MTKTLFRAAVLAVVLVQAGPVLAQVEGRCNEACQPLLEQAQSLQGQGKLRDAWDAFQRAHQADPKSSFPLSLMSGMLENIAARSPADKAPAIRQQAGTLAHEALGLNPQDPIAQEVLRQLEDLQPAPLHTPTAEAAQAMQEGEALFAQKRFDEARSRYELAAQRDPKYSSALLYAGDCFYSQKQWPEAEGMFRKATDIEPLNSQAWRFLADSLIVQGKRKEAEAALYGAIGAQPSQLPNWDKLELLMRQDGMTLKHLALVRKVRYSGVDKDGKMRIAVDEKGTQQTPEFAFWLLHAATLAGAAKDANTSPFQAELLAWKMALAMFADMKTKGQPVPTDPALLTMRSMADAGQLESAILLLMYRESYRPELEAWKKAHPDGIRSFVVSTGLRP